MSNTNMEQMKKLINDKKKKSSEQGLEGRAASKSSVAPSQGFKKNKKAGSLNK